MIRDTRGNIQRGVRYKVMTRKGGLMGVFNDAESALRALNILRDVRPVVTAWIEAETYQWSEKGKEEITGTMLLP